MANKNRYRASPVRSEKDLHNLGVAKGEIIGYKIEGPRSTNYATRIGKSDYYDVLGRAGIPGTGRVNGKSRLRIKDGLFY